MTDMKLIPSIQRIIGWEYCIVDFEESIKRTEV